jgi:release factor glutamine methyltransferase
MAINIRAALDAQKSASQSQSLARAEAEILLAHVLNCSRAHLFAYAEKMLSTTEHARFTDLCAERVRGVPIAYLLGQREFFGLTLEVNPSVLIPRHETELLVERALEKMRDIPRARVLDLGTGSGAIACAIASKYPDAQIIGLDQSAAALAVAARNAQQLGQQQIQFVHSEWFAALKSEQGFAVIVSNPPYLAADDPHLMQGDLRFEPRAALAPMRSGAALADIAHIIQTAPRYLQKNGWLLLEHGSTQGVETRQALHAAGFKQVQTLRDYAELERVSEGQI